MYLCIYVSLCIYISLTAYCLLFVQALHETLLRQEDLLAYIDSQEENKFRVSLKQNSFMLEEGFLHIHSLLIL